VPGEETAADTALAGLIKARVRDVAELPQPGVVFKDTTPLLADGQALAAVVSALAEGHRAGGSRGFGDRGPWLHPRGLGRLPARFGIRGRSASRGGRPARPTRELSAQYGTATIEVHQDAFTPGERVLIVDDVLATGSAPWRRPPTWLRRAGAEVAGRGSS
jgi:adenine phosphoribosyltransferase